MTYKDIMAVVGTGFSLTCLAFIVWVVWSGVQQANRMSAYRRRVDERLAELGRNVVVVDAREERVN